MYLYMLEILYLCYVFFVEIVTYASVKLSADFILCGILLVLY